MSQEPPVLAPVACAKCGAANYAHVDACWLCHAELKAAEAISNPYATAQPPRPVATPIQAPPSTTPQNRVESIFLYVLVAIVTLALLVGIGLAVQDQGMLPLYLFVVLPALTATGVRGLYSVAKGEAPKPSKMISTFILSALMTALIGIALVVCSVIFLFLWCATMLSGLGPR